MNADGNVGNNEGSRGGLTELRSLVYPGRDIHARKGEK